MVSLFQTVNLLTLRLYSGDISLLQVKMWSIQQLGDSGRCLLSHAAVQFGKQVPKEIKISEVFTTHLKTGIFLTELYSTDELIRDKHLRLMIGWLTVGKNGKITNEMESVSM